MPQMAPILWVPLMISFSTMLFLTIIKISFSIMKIPSNIKKTEKVNMSKQMNWAW